jgi:hypothetical protein
MPAWYGERRLMTMNDVGYDAASLAIFASFDVAPTEARKAAINTLVVALKASYVWDSLDLLYVLAAADAQAARINWKNPGVKTASAVNAPTFNADRGYTGDGSSSRLDTGWTPSTEGVNYTQDSASMWVWSLTNSQSSGSDAGNLSTPPTMRIAARTATDEFFYRANDAISNTVASTTSSLGFFGSQRRAATDKRAWRNGVQLALVGTASTGIPAQSQWICGANNSAFSSRQLAAAAWGASLSGKELQFYTALLAYMQRVGAV